MPVRFYDENFPLSADAMFRCVVIMHYYPQGYRSNSLYTERKEEKKPRCSVYAYAYPPFPLANPLPSILSSRPYTHPSKTPYSFPLAHNLSNSMTNHGTRLLRLLLAQAARNAHLQRRSGLPSGISWVEAEANGEGFEAGDEDAVCEAL